MIGADYCLLLTVQHSTKRAGWWCASVAGEEKGERQERLLCVGLFELVSVSITLNSSLLFGLNLLP